MAEDKKYGGSASSTSRPGLSNPINRDWQKNIERMAQRRSTQSKKSKASKTPRPAGLMGSADVMERRLKAASKGSPLVGRSQGLIQSNQADQGNWLDEYGVGGGGGGGGSVRSFSDAQIAAAQARLQAIFDRYAQDIAEREAAIGANYDTAGTNLGSIYDTSVGNISKAYEAARAAQTQQQLNLGMTEQTPVQSFGNETAATTSLQNLRAAVLAQNEASRKAAITNQRLASEAAKRQGTETIAQTVAEMQSAMTPVSGGGGGGGGLTPYQMATLRMRQEENDMANQQAAAKMLASQRPAVDRQAILNQVAGKGLTTEEFNMFRALSGGN